MSGSILSRISAVFPKHPVVDTSQAATEDDNIHRSHGRLDKPPPPSQGRCANSRIVFINTIN